MPCRMEVLLSILAGALSRSQQTIYMEPNAYILLADNHDRLTCDPALASPWSNIMQNGMPADPLSTRQCRALAPGILARHSLCLVDVRDSRPSR